MTAGPARWMPTGTWPDGPIASDAPAAVRVAAHAARVIATEAGPDGLDTLAAAAGVDPPALHAVVDGDEWPDIEMLAALEGTLGRSLWP